MRFNKIVLLFSAIVAPCIVQAKVELPNFITDSMVVQHNATLRIPAKAAKGSTVKVTTSWNGETLKFKADKKGSFVAVINTPDIGGPYTITFDDGKKTTIKDVFSGDVWFCSGQSNMEMPVQGWGRVMNYREEVSNADYPMVRLLQVKKQTSYGEKENTDVNMDGWRTATPETVGEFSAIGYFFGRDINQQLDIPIGIIDCTWGGTPIEAWMSYASLKGADEFGSELQAIERCNFDESVMLNDYNTRMSKWAAEVLPATTDFDISKYQSQWGSMPVPGVWEGSVLPAFDGVVWMQKEINLTPEQAAADAKLSLSMIDDEDVTYVNGEKVGASSTYNYEREYNVPASLLKPGKNLITIRIVDTGGDGGFWGEADNIYLKTASGKVPLAGEWKYKVTSDFVDNPVPISPVSPNYPTVLHNAMMHPITAMPVKGVLWYQGCANVGRAPQYSKLFKIMIEDWRKEWNNPEMPFYFVQLANYLKPLRFQPNSQWAALRQAQKDALELENTGMAVAIDLGNPDDIHPKNKQEVARRLANMALEDVYGNTTGSRAPEVASMNVYGRNIILAFDGEVMQNGGGQGYIVKDADGHWAQGYGRQIGKYTIEVSSDEVGNPVEVRYDWADCPDGNLRGANGLPVSPFIAK